MSRKGAQKSSAAMLQAAAQFRSADRGEVTSLYSPRGARKYLNMAERASLLAVIHAQPDAQRLFALTLFWTGARLSEVLALRASSFQLTSGVVAIRTLKRRRLSIREVPIPSTLLLALNEFFQLDAAAEDFRLWRWSRTTAWRLMRRMMAEAGLRGPAATARGMRHGFAVASLQAGVPITLLQRWMGHARLSTTAIYAGATGPEERQFAERVWAMAA